jgi:ADP-ribose pyrophosphatase YjhB (NUDIX family)
MQLEKFENMLYTQEDIGFEKIHMSEEESLALRITADISISVVALVPRVQNNIVSLLFNQEFNENPYLPKFTTKMPSGSMEFGESWKDTLLRRIPLETGFVPQEMKLCFVADYGSSDKKKHLKIFAVITSFSGTLKRGGYGNVAEVNWENPFSLKKIAFAQQIALFDCLTIIKQLWYPQIRLAS